MCFKGSKNYQYVQVFGCVFNHHLWKKVFHLLHFFRFFRFHNLKSNMPHPLSRSQTVWHNPYIFCFFHFLFKVVEEKYLAVINAHLSFISHKYSKKLIFTWFQTKVNFFFFNNLIIITENEIFEPYTSLGNEMFCPSITMTRIIGSLVTRWCTLLHLTEVTNGRKERQGWLYIESKVVTGSPGPRKRKIYV